MNEDKPTGSFDASGLIFERQYKDIKPEGIFMKYKVMPLPAKPSKPAMDLYEAGINLLAQKEIPTEKLRVISWELGGSEEGCVWMGPSLGWLLKGHSAAQKGYLDPKAPVYSKLPLSNSIWVDLTPDEVLSFGLDKPFPLGLTKADKEAPLIRVTFFEEKIYACHELSWEAVPARPRRGNEEASGGALAEINCRWCNFRLWMSELPFEFRSRFIEEPRGTPRYQRGILDFLLSGSTSWNRSGEIRETTEQSMTLPLRETHSLACKEQPFEAPVHHDLAVEHDLGYSLYSYRCLSCLKSAVLNLRTPYGDDNIRVTPAQLGEYIKTELAFQMGEYCKPTSSRLFKP